MPLQSEETTMITHPLSSVYGSYVITENEAPALVTADPRILFENLERLTYSEASRVRVLLVSSEEWRQDDITAFVWEAMAENYAGSTVIPADWDEWIEAIGHPSLGFIQLGYDEFNPNQERAKRKAATDAQAKRLAKFRAAERSYAVAAE